jgi:hypothetical protein
MASPRFLMWYDDNPKLTVSQKIVEAIEAYTSRFRGTTPNIVLVNEADVVSVDGIEVRGVNTIRRNTIWVGYEKIREEIAA